MDRLRIVSPSSEWQTARLLFGALASLVLMSITVGCQPGVESQYTYAPEISELEPELQQAVKQQLVELCGTPRRPKLLGDSEHDEQTLQLGVAVYRQKCQQCHGVSGYGNGPAAVYLTPRPRDFRKGIFKFTSTPYGFKPRPADLMRTVRVGVVGTAMPSFRLLGQPELEAVVDYVLALSRRGELEQLLIADADNEGELTAEQAAANAKIVLGRWQQARDNVVEAATPMPPITRETIAAGQAAFLKRECFKCHGRDGRGGLAGGIEVGKDAWGNVDPAADLTSGMLHGGQSPLDIYRRISSGINGTPMPAFKDALASDPDAIWELTHFVMALADQRRRGVQFPVGSAGTKTAPSDETGADAKPPRPKPAS